MGTDPGGQSISPGTERPPGPWEPFKLETMLVTMGTDPGGQSISSGTKKPPGPWEALKLETMLRGSKTELPRWFWTLHRGRF